MNRKFVVVTAAAVVVIASNSGGQWHSRAAAGRGDGLGLAPAGTDTQYRQIRHIVSTLHYTDAVADDFARFVSGWRNAQDSPTLATLRARLANSREAFLEGDVSDAELALIEERMVLELGQCIRNHIGYRRDYFDLSGIAKEEKANCFGYSQVFYIIGSYVGLRVWPASVTQEHIANIVGFSDGTMAMVDLTNAGGFVSERIKTQDKFGTNPDHWRFTDEGRLVRGDKSIRIWNRNEVLGEIYFCRGTTAYMLGRSSEAIRKYDRAIELNPKCAKAYNNRGGAYLILGERAKAIFDFSKALELDPKYTSAYHNRANAYLDSERYADAIIDYTNAIEQDAGHAKAFFGRGFAHLSLEDYARAVSDHTRAIELNPEYARAYYTRAIGHAYLAEDEKARRDILQAVELDRTLKEDAKRISRQFDLDLSLD
ncbi:MAG: tetratricopeptide repeat protein [Planctomycetota bacterium]